MSKQATKFCIEKDCVQQVDRSRTDWRCYYHGKVADGLIDPTAHGVMMARVRSGHPTLRSA